MEKTPEALAYRQNPTAHPDYVSQVFTDMNRCKNKSRCVKRSHPNWLKQVSPRHCRIPRPQKRSCAVSRINLSVRQAACSLILNLSLGFVLFSG